MSIDNDQHSAGCFCCVLDTKLALLYSHLHTVPSAWSKFLAWPVIHGWIHKNHELTGGNINRGYNLLIAFAVCWMQLVQIIVPLREQRPCIIEVVMSINNDQHSAECFCCVLDTKLALLYSHLHRVPSTWSKFLAWFVIHGLIHKNYELTGGNIDRGYNLLNAFAVCRRRSLFIS